MTNPFTHILFSYAVSREITDKPNLVLLGIFMGVVLDLDSLVILPGFEHRGFIHTPFFALILLIVVLIASRNIETTIVCGMNLLVHLILDTVGTIAKIMWFYPASEMAVSVGSLVPIWAIAIIKVVLFLMPVAWIAYKWRKKGQSPKDLLDYVQDRWGKLGLLGLGLLALLVLFGTVAWGLNYLIG